MKIKIKSLLNEKYLSLCIKNFCLRKDLLKFKSHKGSKKIAKISGFRVEYLDFTPLYLEAKYIFMDGIYNFCVNKKKPFIIDCGSFIGLSILYFKSIYPKAEILGFEPDPEIFKVLKRNIERNDLRSVIVVNAGVGGESGILNFFPNKGDGGSLYRINKNVPIKAIVRRLSNYINKPVDLLKMNVEGAEYEVIKEIEKKIHLINEIIIEYHYFDNLDQSLHEILTILHRNGFKYLIANIPSLKEKRPFSLLKPHKYFSLVYAQK